jgi:hypothetical protein
LTSIDEYYEKIRFDFWEIMLGAYSSMTVPSVWLPPALSKKI